MPLRATRSKRAAGLLRCLCAFLLLAVCLAGCKTSRHASTLDRQSGYLSSKVRLTVPTGQAVLTVNGTLKLKCGELVQLSFLMPIFRTEVARLEVTPDTILLVDRMNKRFVRVERSELRHLLPKKAGFAHLEKLIYAAAKPGGKTVLRGSDLGIPSLEKGQLELSDFSDKVLSISPTSLSGRYKEVKVEELLEMLMSL